jgi:hypothetical protein
MLQKCTGGNAQEIADIVGFAGNVQCISEVDDGVRKRDGGQQREGDLTLALVGKPLHAWSSRLLSSTLRRATWASQG